MRTAAMMLGLSPILVLVSLAGLLAQQPPKPEPGDSVKLDPATDEIIAVSRGRSIRLRNQARDIHPVIAVATSQSTSGAVRYDYRFRNGRSARRGINGLILDMPEPAGVTAAMAPGWVAMSGTSPPSMLFTKNTPDTDPRLAPGTAIAFTLTSRRLPGLVAFRVLPLPRQTGPGELTDGQFFEGASAWVRARLLELDTMDRHEARGRTIGPRIDPMEDSLRQITGEMREAGDLPDFASVSQRLAGLLPSATKAKILSLLNVTPTNTPPARAFVQAMRLRLNHLLD